MATVAFPTISKSTRLPNGTTYSYVHIEPQGQKPWILFLHGFPSASYDWRHQVNFFRELGYGILCPDLLGYGGTDKPTDLEAYRLKKMSEEVVAILDAEGVDKVLAVAHDWGSALLSRLANYSPNHFIAYCFMSVGYGAPQGPFDIDSTNELFEKAAGYPAFAYWYFFNSPDAGELMDRDVERTSSLVYAEDGGRVKDIMCVRGATRPWFADSQSPPFESVFIPRDDLAIHQQIFDPKKGGSGYGPGLNWYKALIANVNVSDESSIPPERHHIEQPTLAIFASGDFFCIPAVNEEMMRPYVKNLKVETVDAGHFFLLQKPDETNKILKEFFDEVQEKTKHLL